MNYKLLQWVYLGAMLWSVGSRAQTDQAYKDSIRLHAATQLHDRYILSDSTEEYTFDLLLDDPTLSSRWTTTLGLGLGYTERQLLFSAHLSGYVEPLDWWRIYFNGEAAPSISLAKPLISNPQAQRSTYANTDMAFSLFKSDNSHYAALILSDRHTRVDGKDVIHFSDFRRIQSLNILLGLGVHQRASDPRADTLSVLDPNSERIVLKPGNYYMNVVRFGIEWQEKSTRVIKVNNELRPMLSDARVYAQVLMAIRHEIDVSHFRYQGTEYNVVPATFEIQPFDFQEYGFLLGLQAFILNRQNPGRRHSIHFELGVLPGIARPGHINNFFVHLRLGFWGFGSNLKKKINRKYPEVDW